MKMNRRILNLAVIFTLMAISLPGIILQAQWQETPRSMIGIGAFHNFQTESQALELRYRKHFSPNLSVVPRFSYYFPGNKIHEYYAGVDLNYTVNVRRKVQPYLLAGAYYNNWINHEQYGASAKKKNNFVVEGGCGLLFNIGCRFKPYLEWRYDTKWKEGSLGAGIFISFAKCRRGNGKCPAYPKSF
jgi:hypothetical protein